MAESKKLSRKPNFSDAEIRTLLAEIAAEREILLSKLQNVMTIKSKHCIWEQIASKVNECGVAERTTEEIRSKWKDLKKRTISSKIAGKKSGGGHLPESGSPYDNFILDIIGEETAVRCGIPVYRGDYSDIDGVCLPPLEQSQVLTSQCELLGVDSNSSEPPAKKNRTDAVSSSATKPSAGGSSSVQKGREKVKNLKEKTENKPTSSNEDDDPLHYQWFSTDVAASKIITQAARAFIQKCELEKTYLQLKIIKLKKELGLPHNIE